MMTFTKQEKISAKNKNPDELTLKVAQCLVDLEAVQKDLRADLRDLQICLAKEVSVKDPSKKAIIVVVPYVQHQKFQKIQRRLVQELEKKFSQQHVVFVAQRTILDQSFKRKKGAQNRPRTRTLMNVHAAILRDVVYPTQILGMRTRYKQDGQRLMKIELDSKDMANIDNKLVTYAEVYKELTTRNVMFHFGK